MSKDIFSNNPTIDLYYKTSDDTPFFTKNAAQNHARTLEDKSVNKVTRTSLKVAVPITDTVSEKGEAKTKTVEADSAKTKKKEIQTDLPTQEPPKVSADQIKDEGSADTEASQDVKIEDTAAEYNQAVSDYKEKFGEAPFEGAELTKIKWAIQFNKQLTKS